MTNTRLLNIGNAFSSLSVNNSELALIRYATRSKSFSGIANFQETVLLCFPVSIIFCTSNLPKTSGITSFVKGLNHSNDTSMGTFFSVILTTVAANSIVSPARKKRGALGCTINSFCAMKYSVNCPLFISLSCARALNFQVVKASGRVNSNENLPSLSA